MDLKEKKVRALSAKLVDELIKKFEESEGRFDIKKDFNWDSWYAQVIAETGASEEYISTIIATESLRYYSQTLSASSSLLSENVKRRKNGLSAIVGEEWKRDFALLRSLHIFAVSRISDGKRREILLHQLDGRAVPSEPKNLLSLARILVRRLNLKRVTKIVGFAEGGITSAHAVSIVTELPFVGSYRIQLDMPGIHFTEPHLKARKDHYIYALERGDKVVIIDDETTSGDTLVNAIKALRDYGVEVVDVGCFIETVGLGAREKLAALGLDLKYLVQIPKIELKERKVIVFIDRDGTIIQERTGLKGRWLRKIKLLPDAAEGIKMLNDRGVLVICISNQSEIARGNVSERTVRWENLQMELALKMRGAHLDGIYFCPHRSDGKVRKYAIECNCRKPKTDLYEKAFRDFGLKKGDLRIYVIGDGINDILVGKALMANRILVRTGRFRETSQELLRLGKEFYPHKANAKSIKDAVEWMLQFIG